MSLSSRDANWLEPGHVAKPKAVYFEKSEREWMAAKWKLIRDAMQTADQAVAKWRKLNDEIGDYLDRSGITEIDRRKAVKSANLLLDEYMSTSTWFRKEADVHIADVTLYLMFKELGVHPWG